MGTVRKTVLLTDQQEQWIKARIATGDFASDSDYIRELIQRDSEIRKRTASCRRSNPRSRKGWTAA